jgi:hypothetical protein
MAGCTADPAPTLPLPAQPATPTPVTQSFEFTVAPIEASEFVHTIGREWSGYYTTAASFSKTWGSDEVFAPAAGRVVGTSGDGSRVDLVGADSTRFYLTGLESTTTFVGLEVNAGDTIGRRRRDSRNRLLAIRLGVFRPTLLR